MLHHEESPEKPQYNMATPPFLDKPPILPNLPFSSKNFQAPPISITFERVEHPLYEGGGVRTTVGDSNDGGGGTIIVMVVVLILIMVMIFVVLTPRTRLFAVKVQLLVMMMIKVMVVPMMMVVLNIYK